MTVELISDGYFVEEGTLLSRQKVNYLGSAFRDGDYCNSMSLRN